MTLRREKHSRRLQIVRDKLAMTSRNNEFSLRHSAVPWTLRAPYIYGYSRIYETIDPPKQPMRFPQFICSMTKFLMSNLDTYLNGMTS